MASDRRVICQVCEKHASEVGPISWRGKCGYCGTVKLAENVVSMRTRSGPQWRAWRRGMAACVGGVLLDDVRGEP